jgi:diacylglycerol kinase (ATP)
VLCSSHDQESIQYIHINLNSLTYILLADFKSALLLVNRHARRSKKLLGQMLEQLQTLNLDLVEVPTTDPKHLPELIRQHRDRVDLVIIGGGDGTLNTAIAGLVDTQLPLAILPLGTANDLARTLKIPKNPLDACQLIAQGRVRAIDLGWVNDKYFFNVASFGLSTQITRRLTDQVKQKWGVLAYGITALQAVWHSRPIRAEIRYDDQSIQVQTLQIAVGNGRYYGGGMTVNSKAAIDDNLLDLYSLENQNRWEFLYLLPAMFQGQHTKLPSVRSLHGQEFEVHTNRPYPINTDGELTTYTPAQFRLIPKAVNVVVPETFGC